MNPATIAPSFALHPPPVFLLDSPPQPALDHPWHAIRVRHGAEFAVADSLASLLYESYCPRYWLSYVVRNRRREFLVPYLAAWVFARWDASDAASWHEVRNLTGVADFVGGEYPSPIRDDEMDVLRSQIGLDHRRIEALPPTVPFVVGDVVRFTDGPYAGHAGRVVYLHPSGMIARVEILALHGLLTPVTCSASWCEPDRDVAVSGGTGASVSPSRARRLRRRRYLESVGCL